MKLEKHLGIGALIAAILASSCCWLPILVIAVGGSTIGFASIFTEHKTIFGIVAFTLLGIAFYFAYRKPKACCTTEIPTSKVKPVNKVLLWVITPFVIVFALFPDKMFSLLAVNKSTGISSPASKTISANEARITLRVEGMT